MGTIENLPSVLPYQQGHELISYMTSNTRIMTKSDDDAERLHE